MFGTVQATDLAKVYETKQRKGLFKSERRDVEALESVSLEVKSGEILDTIEKEMGSLD